MDQQLIDRVAKLGQIVVSLHRIDHLRAGNIIYPNELHFPRSETVPEEAMKGSSVSRKTELVLRYLPRRPLVAMDSNICFSKGCRSLGLFQICLGV